MATQKLQGEDPRRKQHSRPRDTFAVFSGKREARLGRGRAWISRGEGKTV